MRQAGGNDCCLIMQFSQNLRKTHYDFLKHHGFYRFQDSILVFAFLFFAYQIIFISVNAVQSVIPSLRLLLGIDMWELKNGRINWILWIDLKYSWWMSPLSHQTFQFISFQKILLLRIRTYHTVALLTSLILNSDFQILGFLISTECTWFAYC